jgi:succinate dehydrogenase / fumarate reductase cytochrome b subunit
MLHRLAAFLRSSIGRKLVMSLTGAALIAFVLVHLLGNLTLYADTDGAAFNSYAHLLEVNPLLPLAEIGLTVLFVVHIGLGIRTALDNREARPTRYKDLAPHGNRTLASTTMIVTGLLVLVFLVVHLIDFRFAERHADGLAYMVVQRLATPLGAVVYLIGVVALGVHLWHAVQSVFQTLGLYHPRYRPMVVKAGWVLAVLVGLGFATFPLVIFTSPESLAQPPAESAEIEPGQQVAPHPQVLPGEPAPPEGDAR